VNPACGTYPNEPSGCRVSEPCAVSVLQTSWSCPPESLANTPWPGPTESVPTLAVEYESGAAAAD
jgi:hypothetical protein